MSAKSCALKMTLIDVIILALIFVVGIGFLVLIRRLGEYGIFVAVATMIIIIACLIYNAYRTNVETCKKMKVDEGPLDLEKWMEPK